MVDRPLGSELGDLYFFAIKRICPIKANTFTMNQQRRYFLWIINIVILIICYFDDLLFIHKCNRSIIINYGLLKVLCWEFHSWYNTN